MNTKGEKVHTDRSFSKFIDLLLADSNGQITRQPHYSTSGGIIAFHVEDTPSTVTSRIDARIDLHTARDDGRIVAITVWLPNNVYAAMNRGLALVQPKKIPWWLRKLRVLLVHLKYLLRLDATTEQETETSARGQVLPRQPDVDNNSDTEHARPASTEGVPLKDDSVQN